MAIDFTPSELMAVRAAEELKDFDVVFVGIGLPNLACNLARATHAPNLFMIYESGAVGTVPERLPISIGDPALVTDSLSIATQADIFQSYLQNGLIEVGFLGGAQIDRFGNINTTVIGDYAQPKVRLPGSGGACEIATHSKRLLVVMRMNPKAFVQQVDFVTSPGHRFASKISKRSGVERADYGMSGEGPSIVVTDLGVCEFADGEMTLTELFPGVTVEKVKAQCGWDLKVAGKLRETKPPTEAQIGLLRNKLDPQKLYL